MKNRGIGLLTLFMIAVPFNAKAKVGTMNIESPNLKVGETKEINVLVSKDIAAADGFVKTSDNSCLEIINVKSDFGSGNYFASIDLNGEALTKATTITVKGLKECNAKIIIDDASIVSVDGMEEDRNLIFESSNIIVEEQKKEEVIPKAEENIVKEEVKTKTEENIKTNRETISTKKAGNKKQNTSKKENKIEQKTNKKVVKKQKNTTKKIINIFKLRVLKRLFK